jgi:O-antigen/teichoic acid export membrane protein
MKASDKLNVAAFLMLMTRSVVKLLSIISSLILVRILSPEDFGIVAVSMSVYIMIEIFGMFGFNTVLIQKQKIESYHYDTCFTINIIFAACAASLLFGFSDILAIYLNIPELEEIFNWIALMFIINSAVSIKVINFQRNMDFRREMFFQVAPKVFSFIVTISLAFYYKSYWALIYGMLFLSLLKTFQSYLMAPYVPQLSFRGIKDISNFSGWLVLNNICLYLNTKFLDLYIGKEIGTSSAGIYSFSHEIASVPPSEIAASINKATYPAYSQSQNDQSEFQVIYNKSMELISTISLPCALGLALTSEYFIPLFLGENWLDAVEIFQLLAFAFSISCVSSHLNYIFLAKGLPKISTLLNISKLIVLFISIYFLIDEYKLSGVAIAVFIAEVFFLILELLVLHLKCILSLGTIINPIKRPFYSILFMSFTLTIFHHFCSGLLTNSNNFILSVIIGGASYIIAILTLWNIAGKPNSIEASILQQVNRLKEMLYG